MNNLSKRLDELGSVESMEVLFKMLYFDKTFTVFEYYDAMSKHKMSSDVFVNRVEDYAGKIKTVCNERLISDGESIGIKLSNSIDYIPVFWAAMKAGFRPVLIGATEEEYKVLEIVIEANIQLVISDVYDEVTKAIDLAELDNSHPSGIDTQWSNEFALVTSGTTGQSGIYVHDFNSLKHQFQILNYGGGILSGDETKVLMMLPLHHVFALFVSLTYTAAYATIVMPESISPQNLFFACQNSKVTHIPSVPLFWSKVAQKIMSNFDKSRLSEHSTLVKNMTFGESVELLISGGAKLNSEVQKTLEEIGYVIAEGYGMTEFGFASICPSHLNDERTSGSLGMTGEFVQYEIEKSRLYVKSKSMYCGEIVSGERLINENRNEYFDTGDCGRLNEDHLYLSGRAKDIIIGESGENIYPAEIEDAFLRNGFNYDFTVLGLKKEKDEVISMFVHTAESELESMTNVFKLANESLTGSRRVRQLIYSKSPLLRTSTNKVMKHKMRQQLKETYDSFENICIKYTKNKTATSDEQYCVIKKGLIQLLSEITEINVDDLKPNESLKDQLDLDSFDVVHFTHSVEDAYAIEITETDIANLITLNHWQEFIKQSGVAIAGGSNETA